MSRTLVVALTAVLTLGVGTPPGAAVAAVAAPGPVSELHLAEVTRPAGVYDLTVAWRAGVETSSYRVRARDEAGTLLDEATVTTTTWRAEVDAVAGQQVTVTVRPRHGHVRGPAARLTATLPDLTPPTGSFTAGHVRRVATLTQAALGDDVSPRRSIVRSVRWGDGTPPAPWPRGLSTSHRYPGPGSWHPVVRLVDAAGNATSVSAGAVVVGDRQPPTGAFSASPTAAWATLSEVGVTELALGDDRSAPGDIARTVLWGDGSSTPWPAGEPVGHVYETDGVFTPAVRLVDEAGHHRVVDADPVTVSRDREAPTVRVREPAHRTSVRSWHTVAGRATDLGAGVAVVRVRAVQERADGWYAYHPGDGAWVQATGRRAAWRRARTAQVLPSPAGRWLVPVRPLRRGLLEVRVTARDNVGNSSDRVVRRERLLVP